MIASKRIQLQSLLHVLPAPPSQMISTATPELLIWSLLSMVYLLLFKNTAYLLCPQEIIFPDDRLSFCHALSSSPSGLVHIIFTVFAFQPIVHTSLFSKLKEPFNKELITMEN